MAEELKTIETVDTSPFKHLVMTLGELPTSFVDSMTYYECLAWLVNFIQNTVIPTVNNNAEAVKELQTAFTTLKNYVDNYFDNLDVQDEINNKLDEMAESGQLTDIIASYIQLKGILAFNTVSELKNGENIVNGSFAETYGFHTLNDGGSAKYKIRTLSLDDTVDERKIIAITNTNLVAELICNKTINVKQIGAYGDGTHDDTDVFKYAVNNFNKINVPFGEYLITDTIFIPANVIIEGENNNSFSNGYEHGTTILYESTGLEDPCFSFLGKDRNNVNHKEIYAINGSELDNGDYVQTLNSALLKVNIRTTNHHNVAVVFTGCPNSELQVSCYGFICGIITSACWGSNIHDCFALCNYGIYCGADNNGVKLCDSYFDCSDKTITIPSDSKLYPLLLGGQNAYGEQKDKPSGLITVYVNNLIISNVICEHFKIGFNFFGHSTVDANGLYGEQNDVFCATYTGNIKISGIYAFTSIADSTCFLYNITKFTVENCNSNYAHLLVEKNTPTTRYNGFYQFKNVTGDIKIDEFNSENPSILYYSNAGTDNSGLENNPSNNIERLFNMIGDNGTIILKSDIILTTSGDHYRKINKNLTITSDGTTRTISNDTTKNVIYPVRYTKDLTIKNVNIIASTQTAPSDSSLSSIFNPFTINQKRLTIQDCAITTSSYNGVINAFYNDNTYSDVNLINVSFTGGCVLTTNHASGSSKKLNINLFKDHVTTESTLVIGSHTNVVSEYAN